MLNCGAFSAEFEQEALNSCAKTAPLNLDAVAQIPGSIAERCVVAHLDWEEVAAQMRPDAPVTRAAPESTAAGETASVTTSSVWASPSTAENHSCSTSSVCPPSSSSSSLTRCSTSASASTSERTHQKNEKKEKEAKNEKKQSKKKKKTPRKYRHPGAAETGGWSEREAKETASEAVDANAIAQEDDEENPALSGMFGWNSDEEFTTSSSSASSSEQSSAEAVEEAGNVAVYRKLVPRVDIIFGSELTYSLLSVKSLVQVILRYLKEDGVFYEILSDDRDGVSAVWPKRRKRGKGRGGITFCVSSFFPFLFDCVCLLCLCVCMALYVVCVCVWVRVSVCLCLLDLLTVCPFHRQFVDAIQEVGFTAHARLVPDCYLGDYTTGQRAETYKFWTFRRKSTAAHYPLMGEEEPAATKQAAVPALPAAAATTTS
jgi:hypothetical protein